MRKHQGLAGRSWAVPVVGLWAAFFAADARGAVVDPIGTVFYEQTQEAWGKPPQNDERELRYTDPVYHEELVRTGPSGGTALQFLDTTRLQVGANSSLVLDRYVFDPDN